MATAQDIINEWAAGDEEKQQLVIRSGLPLRWLNQGQLRFADKSEILRDIWLPTIPSSGNIALPVDFLREFPDMVKRDGTSTTTIVPLKKIDYQVANLRVFSTQTHYSIYNGTFYIWTPGTATPSIPYVKKPATLTTLSSDLSIPTQYQHDLIMYLDAHWAKRTDVGVHYQLMRAFDAQAKDDGMVNALRTDRIPTIRGSWF